MYPNGLKGDSKDALRVDRERGRFHWRAENPQDLRFLDRGR